MCMKHYQNKFAEVFTIDQDGNNIPLSDGEYTLDSGEVLTVVSGKVEVDQIRIKFVYLLNN